MTQKERNEKIKYILDSGLSSYSDDEGVLCRNGDRFCIVESGVYRVNYKTGIGNMYLWLAVDDHIINMLYIQALREDGHRGRLMFQISLYRLNREKKEILADQKSGYTDKYKSRCLEIISKFRDKMLKFLATYIPAEYHNASVPYPNRAVIDHKTDGTCDVYTAGELLEGGAGITYQEAQKLLTDAGYKMEGRHEKQ